MKENVMRKIKLTIAAGCFSGLVIAFAGFAALLGADEAAALARAQAAWQGFGVVHAKFVAPDGQVVGEEWLDRRTGATRSVRYDRLRTGLETRFTVQNGFRIVRWNTYAPGATYVARVFDRGDPWLSPTSRLLTVARALEANQARVVGRRELGRLDLLQVRVNPSRAPDIPGGVHLFAELDQSTFLPVRFTVQAGRETETFDVVSEQLRPTAATRRLFTVNRRWTLRDTRVRYAELATRAPFPVYTLRRSYQSFRFRAAGLHETTERNASFRIQPAVVLSYVGASGRPELTLMEHAAGTADARARLAAYAGQGNAYRVEVAGKKRTVFVLEDRRPLYFAVVVGSTLVKGSTANLSRDELLAALADLRRAR
jgi:hypothetical protein